MAISLTVLGCAAPYPHPGAPCSGYLLRTGQTTVWVDCGSGTFAALQEHTNLRELTALWISHLHPDHCADLLTAFNWAANTPSVPALPVYGPPGWSARLAAMLPQDDAVRLVHATFDVHELSHGHQVQIGDLHLLSVGVEHSVPAFGLRAEHAGAVLAYSGDTGPCPALTDLARDANLLLCEAGATGPHPAHCTPGDAGRTAAQARIRRLVLTHIPHTADPAQAIDTATALAMCPVEAAVPGKTLTA